MTSYFEGLITSGLVGGLCSFASAANVTMIGMISDSAFGASHANTIAARKDTKMTERECALACAFQTARSTMLPTRTSLR